jgi:hypothetical protein
MHSALHYHELLLHPETKKQFADLAFQDMDVAHLQNVELALQDVDLVNLALQDVELALQDGNSHYTMWSLHCKMWSSHYYKIRHQIHKRDKNWECHQNH